MGCSGSHLNGTSGLAGAAGHDSLGCVCIACGTESRHQKPLGMQQLVTWWSTDVHAHPVT